MSAYNYIDIPNQNLVCCICRFPFVDPCTTRTCCHTFCYECIARAITISAHCPVDRCPLNIDDLAPADPLIRNLVDELMVECPQKEAGCLHTCQRMLLPTHVKDSCKYIQVPCPDDKCNKRVLRKDIATHTHTQDTATVAGPSAAQSSHESPASSLTGLTGDSDVKDSTGHPNLSPLMQDLRFSPQPTETANRSYETLEVENGRLRLRLSALEGVVNTLKYELQAVRRTLGPWYRMEDSDMRRGWGNTSQYAGRPSSVEQASPRSVEVDSFAMSSSSSEENASTVPMSVPSQATSPVSPTAASEQAATGDISSYFPPAEEEDVYSDDFIHAHQALPHLSQQNASTSAWPGHASESSLSQHPQRIPFSLSQSQSGSGGVSYAYPPHTFSPAGYPTAPVPPHSDPGVISIPPLNPSIPLPNTLASLHGSIASLAGALSALATTRAQDALYTGEELRSMRAGIHGLRMQLHDVLTAQVAARDTSTPINASMRATDPEGVGSVGIPYPSTPSTWTPYGPRPFGASTFPHMPGGFTKL